MRTARVEYLLRAGSFSRSREWAKTLGEITHAIGEVVWPPGGSQFVLNPSRGRGRGEGNGVKPIKEACMLALERYGWSVDEKRNPLRLDAMKILPDKGCFGLEWETGNISSSHRAINRLLLGHLQGALAGGCLVVPTRELYKYLTDRVGNYAELEPYFDVWKSYPIKAGLLVIIAVEYDGIREGVPRIQKGTDGRALI